jgi:hypothetical protein
MNNTVPIDLCDLKAVLAEVDRRGITLQVHDGKLRYRPHSAMSPDLAKHLKAHEPALLILLARSVADKTELAVSAKLYGAKTNLPYLYGRGLRRRT